LILSIALNNAFDQTWGLDGLGNFKTFDDDGTTQMRTTNAANEINVINNWVDPVYDAAGNMISGPKVRYEGTLTSESRCDNAFGGAFYRKMASRTLAKRFRTPPRGRARRCFCNILYAFFVESA
jgi:hypothetical protein